MQRTTKSVIGFIKSSIKWGIISMGMFFVLCLILSFTSVPFYWHRWFGEMDSYKANCKPAHILMLGGGGMPSESNLIRLHYVSEVADANPGTFVIIAHPHDGITGERMASVLEKSGIEKSRISQLGEGVNTWQQLQALKTRFKGQVPCVYLVTAPEHMRRSVLVCHRLGIKNVVPVPAFENAMFINLDYDFKKSGGRKYVPDVSDSNSLRYDFWNYLKLEIICFRETVALAYYWLNGWI
ncbi:MAG: YdcF family protein [Bacteroidota bacterium]